MKIRNGFISNSSTSSYVCDVCGESQAGMDLCLSDAGMYNCQNGHYFCDSHINEKELTIKQKKGAIRCSEDAHQIDIDNLENMSENEINELYDDVGIADCRYECYDVFCPICQFAAADKDCLYSYLLERLGLSEKEVLSEIKEKFGTYHAFKTRNKK